MRTSKLDDVHSDQQCSDQLIIQNQICEMFSGCKCIMCWLMSYSTGIKSFINTADCKPNASNLKQTFILSFGNYLHIMSIWLSLASWKILSSLSGHAVYVVFHILFTRVTRDIMLTENGCSWVFGPRWDWFYWWFSCK